MRYSTIGRACFETPDCILFSVKTTKKSAILPVNGWCLSKKTKLHNKCQGANNKTKTAVRDVRDDCQKENM